MAQGPTPSGARRRSPMTLSHIVFGIGASARTWDKRRRYAELWWRPREMRGHVWLDEQPVGPWPATTCPPYRVSAGASCGRLVLGRYGGDGERHHRFSRGAVVRDG
uniref:Uncharacterized protein n=1 Tax=Oryza glaberrima TaxID=4538 RepID=A0A679BE73_ORYGL|nr:hypothetical protein [Oryza glaberrima]